MGTNNEGIQTEKIWKKYEVWFWSLILLIGFPWLLNLTIIHLNVPWGHVGGATDWLGFFSNYAGGVLGATVALIIAKSQAKEQRKQFERELEITEKKNEEEAKQLHEREIEKETRQRKINQLPALVFLKYEAERMYNQLKQLESQKAYKYAITKANKFDSEKEKEILEEFLKVKRLLAPLNDECYPYIALVEDIDLQIELMECFNFYKKFANSLSHDPKDSRRSRENLQEKMKELAESQDLSWEEKMKLFNEEYQGTSEEIWSDTEKLLFWEEFEEYKYVDRYEKIIKQIDKEIEETRELKNPPKESSADV
ncbi:hypothetical protein [Bacillus cereus]|uniref:hypothetical protein n=1 Tax=Bacillus cereus TaxID=1396 RepID=UPI0018792086|nr:hypothetical protein [Bacillus cereus]MBE7118609.1 hypothetical protein [Bacillus cereus]